jgi:hypothetical protein
VLGSRIRVNTRILKSRRKKNESAATSKSEALSSQCATAQDSGGQKSIATPWAAAYAYPIRRIIE